MIPVHQPVIGELEAQFVLEALKTGEISGTAGRFVEEFETRFAEYCGCRHGVGVSSGSTALHLAVVLAGIKPGDEVLVSASTNIATANAVVQQGGTVVPIDAERDTWNMDVGLLERAVTARTKAIIPVHLFGHPVDMRAVRNVALQHNLIVIEDAAEAHGAMYEDRKVGGLSDIGCFSFYANKVITTGEGGMLVTNSRAYADRARSLRNLAFGIPRFLHQEVGFNYRMTNLEAAIGLGQFSRIEETIARKRRIADLYTTRLSGVSGLRLPVERDYARNVYWMYGVVVEPDFGMVRDELRSLLASHGVETRTMFCPMHMQPSLVKLGLVRPTACPVAEDLWENGFYLPSGCGLAESTIDFICRMIEQAVPSCA